MKFRLFAKGLVLMASLLAIGWAIKVSGIANHLDANWVDTEIRGQGLAGLAIYVALGALTVGVGLPRQMVCFLGGYAFGLAEGLALAELASIIGCAGCFSYARLLGRDLVRHRFAERLAKLDEFLHDQPLTMTMLVRFLPVGNNLLTNLLAGVSSVRAIPFLIGSLIGYLPQTAIFALLGSGVHVQPVWRTAISVTLFLLSGVMGLSLYRRLRGAHSLDESLDKAE